MSEDVSEGVAGDVLPPQLDAVSGLTVRGDDREIPAPDVGLVAPDAVGRDKFGIGFSGIGFVTPQIKAVAVAPRGSSQYIELNLQNLRSRAYPLYDEVYFYVDRPPGKAMEPRLKEYLRYILSRQGQDAVQRDGKYLPLTAEVVREQLKKLD